MFLFLLVWQSSYDFVRAVRVCQMNFRTASPSRYIETASSSRSYVYVYGVRSLLLRSCQETATQLRVWDISICAINRTVANLCLILVTTLFFASMMDILWHVT